MREAEPSGAAAKMRSVDGFDSASAWRTGDDFLQRREPPVAELTRRLTARAKKVVAYGQRDASLRFELVLNGWAIVLGAGAGGRHVHPLASWSGIYYVRVPPSVGAAGGPNGKAGCLQLTDPRPAAMMITLGPSDAQFLERREVCPAEGLLVLFPSWLSHSVTRLGDASAGERIAVAFNVHGAEVWAALPRPLGRGGGRRPRDLLPPLLRSHARFQRDYGQRQSGLESHLSRGSLWHRICARQGAAERRRRCRSTRARGVLTYVRVLALVLVRLTPLLGLLGERAPKEVTLS